MRDRGLYCIVIIIVYFGRHIYVQYNCGDQNTRGTIIRAQVNVTETSGKKLSTSPRMKITKNSTLEDITVDLTKVPGVWVTSQPSLTHIGTFFQPFLAQIGTFSQLTK